MKTNIQFLNSLFLLSLTATSCSSQNIPCACNIKFQKKDLIGMMRQGIQILNNTTEANTQEAIVMKEYSQLANQSIDDMAKALDKLSAAGITEINNYFNNKISNPSLDPETQQYCVETAQASMNLTNIAISGTAITKDIIRKEYAGTFEYLKKQIDKKGSDFSDLIISLLKNEENTQELIANIKKSTEKTSEFVQKNQEVIAHALLEQMVDVIFQSFQMTQNI